ncbi:MAG: response regulator [Spirochaetales bacterium]
MADREAHTIRDLPILLLAPTGRDGDLLQQLTEREHIGSRRMRSFEEIVTELGPGLRAGGLVIAEEALGKPEVETLLELQEGQPAWSNLPLLILGAPRAGSLGPVEPLIQRGAELLKRPVAPAVLCGALRAAVALRKRQYEVRDLLLESRRLSQRLDKRARQLRRLTAQLTETEERERHRLAEYVHDDLQQVLAGAMFHIAVSRRRLDDPQTAGKALERTEELVLQALEATRNLSQRLSPTSLRRNGLVAGLRSLIDQVKDLHGLKAELEVEGQSEPHDPSVSVFLFRSCQELLLNVVKHAQTDQAYVSLCMDPDRTELEVRDEGRGWVEAIDRGDDSFGLFSIRERAEHLGGSMEITSSPESGFLVRVQVPFSEAPRHESEAGADCGHRSATPTQHEAGAGPKLRILLVDDHVVLRSGLRSVLDGHPEFDIVGERSDGQGAIEAAEALSPDVILMDVGMPIMNGIEATREVKRLRPQTRVIGLSMYDDEPTRRLMREAGAEAYLLKSGPTEKLLAALLNGAG